MKHFWILLFTINNLPSHCAILKVVKKPSKKFTKHHKSKRNHGNISPLHQYFLQKWLCESSVQNWIIDSHIRLSDGISTHS